MGVSFLGFSATIASVVIKRPAIDATSTAVTFVSITRADGAPCPRVPLSIKLASLSNRALPVNDLGWYAHPSVLYAGIRVVSAVGMEPPHDGRSRVRPPRVSRAVQIGRNEPTGMALPTSRQGHLV